MAAGWVCNDGSCAVASVDCARGRRGCNSYSRGSISATEKRVKFTIVGICTVDENLHIYGIRGDGRRICFCGHCAGTAEREIGSAVGDFACAGICDGGWRDRGDALMQRFVWDACGKPCGANVSGGRDHNRDFLIAYIPI